MRTGQIPTLRRVHCHYRMVWLRLVLRKEMNFFFSCFGFGVNILIRGSWEDGGPVVTSAWGWMEQPLPSWKSLLLCPSSKQVASNTVQLL